MRQSYSYDDADGRAYVNFRATITPGTGTATGVNVWVQAPDSFGAADLSLALGADGLGAEWAPVFATWTKYGDECRFSIAAPDRAEKWRIYLVPGVEDRELKPTEKGRAGESPSYQVEVFPPPSRGVGVEYAPCVLGEGGSVTYDATTSATGTPVWRARVTWQWPVDDPAFNTLAGVDVVLDDFDSNTEDLQGSVSVELDATEGAFTTDWREAPSAPKPYRILLISYDTSGRRNSYQYGITPTLPLLIQRPLGGSGQEYAPNVTLIGSGVTATPVTTRSDGTVELQWTVTFSPPSDPRFGGVNVVIKRTGDTANRTIASGRLSPVEFFTGKPSASEVWRVYVVSIGAADGQQNTIVDGVTPYQDVSVGGNTNDLNLARSFNFAQGWQNNTNQLDVGGGGSKPIRFRVADALGALIGWIGDDTANSGFVGGWFKQLRVGGASPASAKITADSAGAVTITDAPLKLTQSGITTRIENATDSVAAYTAGVNVSDAATRSVMAPRASYLRDDDKVVAQMIIDALGHGLIQLISTSGDHTVSGGWRILMSQPPLSNPYISVAQNGAGESRLYSNELRVGNTALLSTTSTTASAGSGSLPAAPDGFINITIGGSAKRIPYYNA